MKKIFVILLGICLALPLASIPSYAVGIPVVDTNAIIQWAKQIDQMKQQIKMMKANLQRLSSVVSNANLRNIKANLQGLMALQQKYRGIVYNYKNFERNWDSVYKSFKEFNGMNASQYANQAKKILTQTDNAIYDAMSSQGLIANMGNDAANLQSLLAASNSSEGALAATQAGNQIAGLQIMQLMRMQQIMATSYRAQTSYYAQEVQNKAMSDAATEKFFKHSTQPSKPSNPNFKIP